MSGYWPNRVAIGDFLADNDVDGDFRVTAKVTGWGSAPIRLEMQDRMQQDGAHDAIPLKGSRIVTVEGVVDLASHAEAQSVSDALCALSLKDLQEFVVDNDATGPRSAMTRVEVGADPEWVSPECFTYTVQLRASDPLKYGPATFASTTLAAAASGTGRTWARVWPRSWGVTADSTAGTAVAPNAGTSAYWPMLRIRTGVDCLNPVIRLAETGDSLAFDGTIPAGQWIDIDAGSRGVTFGAGMTDVRHLVDVSGLWLAVPIGGATYSLDADSGDSSTVLEVYGYEGAWS